MESKGENFARACHVYDTLLLTIMLLHYQVDILLRVYRNWQHSSDVHAIIVKGAGGKVRNYGPSRHTDA